MARAIWKGSISFGLVQVPVGLYTAEQRDELSLSLLDRHDLAPVGYERVNRRTGSKVAWKDIVKGYAYQKGKYVVVTDEDMRNANVRATQTIDILAFVDKDEISPLYYDTPYYLAPAKQGTKAYAILRDTLHEADKVGIAKVVIRTRQHLAALLVQGEMLVLQLLRFSHELRRPDDLDVPAEQSKPSKATARELEMAKQLVASMVEPWDPSQYHDEYRDDLLARIKRKAKHGEIEDVPESEKAPPERGAKVIDLVGLLKKSMEQKHGPGGGRKHPHAKAHAKETTGNGRAKGAPHRTHPTRKAPARKTA
ncbi:MAG TPA: Ku protein [Polyangiaceae bacterium]|jgi:DNA end-binding protein Ku|nr:Ku protein [Polyangiaceae bacterium]